MLERLNITLRSLGDIKVRWLTRHALALLAVLSILGAAVLGLAGAATNDKGQIRIPVLNHQISKEPVAWTGFALLLLGAAAALRQSANNGALERQKAAAEAKAEAALSALTSAELALWNIAAFEIQAVSTQLKYLSAERISLFVQQDEGFVRVARYSANPLYNKQSRSTHPANEGCLGQAWAMKFAYATDLPDPKIDLEQWIQAQVNDWSFQRNVQRT